jgi:serine/threonine-protein kinase HipA
MPRKRTRIPLKVFLNARLVGRLTRQSSGAIEFQYDQTWLDWEHGFAVSLSLPLREDRYIGDPVIAVFDNLLPDNDEIRRRLAARHQAGGIDAYSLLAAIGRDCVGALQFLPDDVEPGPAGVVTAKPVSEKQIGEILANLEAAPLGTGADEEFRISLAGAQEKTALLYWDDTWHIPKGSTPTTHILKPQIGRQNGRDLSQSVENEFLCMQILGALGLPVAETQIADFDGVRALVIKRFDRQQTGDGRLLRVPQEDCCQALSIPPSSKYERDGGPGIPEIHDFLKGSDDPLADQSLFVKAQVAFWILAATDGHAKNFSIRLNLGGGFRLTPLYDVMSTQPLFAAGQLRSNQMRHAMAVGDNRHYRLHEILPRHFHQTAAQIGMAEAVMTGILDEIGTNLQPAIDKVLRELPRGFPDEIRDAIVDGAIGRLRLVDAVA